MIGYKKHRGLKRYYKNLSIKNDFGQIESLGFDNPDDNWHIHFDWKGYGDNSFIRRKPHLDKLFRHFDILVNEAKNIKTEFQLYAVILDYSSTSDALFLHPPKTNNIQFPFKISDLQLISTLKNKSLNGYIDHLVGYKKLYGQAGEAFCLLYKEAVGTSFL